MTGLKASSATIGTKILLIEDEQSVATFLRKALERRGYEVAFCSSAVEGLQLLASGDFRGVISDFRTPGGITGADVRDWIHRHRPELASRIVFITGDTASVETAALLAQDVTPCVEKPFRVQQLMDAVERTIGQP